MLDNLEILMSEIFVSNSMLTQITGIYLNLQKFNSGNARNLNKRNSKLD